MSSGDRVCLLDPLISSLRCVDEDSVEISGFSGFVVGLAFLPHTGYALLTAVNIARLRRFLLVLLSLVIP